MGLKHLADRLFGYLRKSGVFGEISPGKEVNEWETFIGKDIKPSDKRFLANPSYNRSTTKNTYKTLIENLKKIHCFLDDLQFDEVADIVKTDIHKLEQLEQEAQKTNLAKLAKKSKKPV